MLASVINRWTTAFSAETTDDIVALYAADASLWGTISPVRRDTPETIRDYFEKVFPFTGRKVTIHDSHIRSYGDTAVASGTYTFEWIKDEKPVVIPARFSFTFVNNCGQWLIVDHHSSIMPDPLG